MRIRASSSSSSSVKHASACTSHSSNTNNNNSSVSSSNSTPSISSASSSSPSRCEGLTMLVKAAAFSTTGSVVGVPYVQRRIIIRRRKRSKALVFHFDSSTMLTMNQKFDDGVVKKDEDQCNKKAVGLHQQKLHRKRRPGSIVNGSKRVRT